MNRAAGAETARLRELQRLHDDALPRERCIAVHQYRHDLVTLGVVAALLASPHRALDYRIDDLEMRGIEGERDVHVAGRGAQVGRVAFVILDVAGTLPVVLVVFTLELREQLRRGFSQHIDQYVKPATVRHAQHEFLDSGATPLLDQIVQQRNQCIAAFEREALLADVLGMQIALETFCGCQLPEQVAPLLSRETILHAAELELILQPQPLIGVRYVGKFGADMAAIDRFEARDNFAQRRAFGNPFVAARSIELAIEVGIAETRIVEIQHPRARALLQTERIDMRDQMTAVAVDLHEPRYRCLLFAGHASRRGACRSQGAGLGARSHRGDDRTVRSLGATAGDAGRGPPRGPPGGGQRVEEPPPGGSDVAGTAGVLLEEPPHMAALGP